MSEPVSGNHNDLFDIEVQFEVVFAILEEAGMPTDGLFVKGCRVRFRRLQVGLRKKGRYTQCTVQSKEKRMWTGMNRSMKSSIKKGNRWKKPLHGWTDSDRYSTGSTPQHRAGKDSIS
ncbi:MAG: hypothetical protein NXH90_14115 [Flavobacteriaceae bacterium]|nr:hypothetical protein [Flavobacteriaceae bacterium]